MKTIIAVITASLFSAMTFSASAQSVTASGTTLDL